MVNTFEQLHVWKKASKLGSRVHTVARFLPTAKDGYLADQLHRQADRIVHTIEKGTAESQCKSNISLFKDAYDVTLQLRRNLENVRSRGYLGQHAFSDIEKCINDILIAVSRHIRMLEYLDDSLDASRAYSYTLLFW